MVQALNEKALLYIFGDDKTILITGSKGCGKTNLAAVIFELLVVLGYAIWTNIHFFKYENIPTAINKKKLAKKSGHIYIEKHPNIHMISSLSETLLGIINSGPRGKAVFLDEAGIHASSSHATSKSTRTIKDINKIIRHFESAFILITQTKGSVPPDLREKDVDYHFKVTKRGSTYEVNIGKKKVEIDDEGEEYITFPPIKTFKIPLSKFPCDGKFPTGFEVDIDLKKVLDKLSKVEDSIEIMDRGIGQKILEEMINEKKKEIKYLSTGKYAKKYGVTTQTVWNWCKNEKVECMRTTGGFYRVLDVPPNFK